MKGATKMNKRFKRSAVCGFALAAALLGPAAFAADSGSADSLPARLDYLQTSGAKHVAIDTGYYVQTNTCVDLDMQLIALYNGQMQRIFGLYPNGGAGMTMLLYGYPTQSTLHEYRVRMGPFDKSANVNTLVKEDLLRHTHTLDAFNAEYYLDGERKWSDAKYKPLPGTPQSSMSLRFFQPNTTVADWDSCYPSMRLFGSKFYEWENGEKVLKRDWVPWRAEDGRLGVYDLVTESFKPQDAEVLTWRLAFSLDEATLRVHEGTLANEHLTTEYMRQCAQGIAAIEKVTSKELKAGAVTKFDVPLTIAKGAFSLQDDTAKEYAVNGALTLKGGVTVKLDLTQDGCDRFTATALDVSEASAKNPISISVNAKDVTGITDSLIIVASGLKRSDVEKFKLLGNLSAKLSVRNGALVLCRTNEFDVGDNAYMVVNDGVCTFEGTGRIDGLPEDFDRGSITDVVVGDGITELGGGLFKGCLNLGAVTLGKDVRTVGEEAFFLCPSLATLAFANPNLADDDVAKLADAVVYTVAIDEAGKPYTIPEITIPGYGEVLEGKADLNDEDWTPLEAGKAMEEYQDIHFFRYVIRKVVE